MSTMTDGADVLLFVDYILFICWFENLTCIVFLRFRTLVFLTFTITTILIP